MLGEHLNAKAISVASLAIVECGKHRGKRKSFPFSVWQASGQRVRADLARRSAY